MKVAILSPAFPPLPGGVSDYTRRFAEALSARGVEVTVITGPGAEGPGVEIARAGFGLGGVGALEAQIMAIAPDVVICQYVPHMYERRGMPAGLPALIWRLGRRGVPVVTMAHELYYGRHEGARFWAPGLWQRLALLPLFAGSRQVVLTVPDRLARMRRCFPAWRDRFSLMPIAANLQAAPPEAAARFRAGLDLPDSALVLLFLGLSHPSKELAALTATLDRLVAAGLQARLLVVGGARLDHPHAINLGFLAEAEASAAIALADLALLPFADGASTRRTSLMNALAAGLPVLSTTGSNTDPALLPETAIRRVAAGDPAAFASAALALAEAPEARAALGAAGRALYRAQFDWEVLAPRWLALLEGLTTPSSRA